VEDWLALIFNCHFRIDPLAEIHQTHQEDVIDLRFNLRCSSLEHKAANF
jgi:hypothetical protein